LANGSPKAVSQYDVACAHAASAAQVDAMAPATPDSTTLTAPGPDTQRRCTRHTGITDSRLAHCADA
jgi:hypothetical protein